MAVNDLDRDQATRASTDDEIYQDLAALANPKRIRLLPLLTTPRYGEELADLLGTSRQGAMRHIQKLEERGFVRALNGWRPTGPVVEYEVVPQKLFALSVAIARLGRLKPKGGPLVRRVEPTMRHDVPQHVEDAADGHQPYRQLLLLTGPDAGQPLILDGDRDRWTIGRESDRDLRLDHDPYVSGCHAELQADADGGVDVVDVNSANGTFVNFVRIPKGGRLELKTGDVIGVGHTLLAFQRL